MSLTVLLRNLHRLRKHLRDLQSEIDLGPRVLKARQQRLADEEKAHKDAYETIKKLKLKQKDDEISLKTAEASLAKYQAQLNSAASKKEFDAKTTEIATATSTKGTLEDAILTTITEIEERTANLPQVEAQWAGAQKSFADFQIEAKERLDRLTADRDASQKQLAELETQIPANVKAQYDRLVRTHGPDGLAGVMGRTCKQCRTSLTEQQKTDVQGGMFFCCPNCGRALYPDE